MLPRLGRARRVGETHKDCFRFHTCCSRARTPSQPRASICVAARRKRPAAMNTERWERVGDIFERLLEVPQDQRDKHLESLCGADDELRGIVISMLDSREGLPLSEITLAMLRDTSRSALAALAFAALERRDAAPHTGDGEGTRVGRERLARRIGAGGMGVVWLAER
ncbi:MAG: hypothetical protein ABI846_15425, partial [Rudaea sp.]